MNELDLTALRLSQQNARKKVQLAIKAGILARPTRCAWCGQEGKLEAHHKDYNDQLSVLWLCPRCHSNYHSQLVQAFKEMKKDNRKTMVKMSSGVINAR